MHKRMIIALLMVMPLACTNATETPPAVSADPVVSPGKPLHPIQVRIVNGDALKAGVDSEAMLVVSSSRPTASMEVTVTPQAAAGGLVIMEDRFMRKGSDLAKGGVTLPLHFRPAGDGPQPIEVLVRAVAPDGSVMSRAVRLDLGAGKQPPAGKKPPVSPVPDEDVPAGEDVVVEAKQELDRDN